MKPNNRIYLTIKNKKKMNNFNGVGRLGNDPEKREFNNGNVVSKFSIAVSESYKDQDGNWKEKTEWINCECFRDLSWLKKGDLISIEGKMKTTQNEGKYYTVIVVFKLNRLLKSEGKIGGQNPVKKESKPKQGNPEEILENDDLPF